MRARRAAQLPLVLLASFGALLALTFGVFSLAESAYVANTFNAGSSVAAGTVMLADDDGGTAPFTVESVGPGDSGQRCVKVTYGGSLTASVKLYFSSVGGSLGDQLRLTVDQGTGTTADCADFAASGTLVANATATSLGATYTTFASGLDSWSPAGGAGATRSYRVSWRLPVEDANAAQGQSLSLGLAWEAQSA